MFTVIDSYVDPRTKEALISGDEGNLYKPSTPERIAYENHDGIYDFVADRDDSEDSGYYDNLYSGSDQRIWSAKDFRRMWLEEPGFCQLLGSMGDIRDKKILLLGNGISMKEFYFLRLGAKCVYTDISVEAIKYIKALFDKSELKQHGFDQIEFHAADACQLPFANESFDVIYGCAFVHHIKDIDVLFAEIVRCLKPGGICRFLDHAYSGLWQGLKATVLKPLQLYSHRKHGISPADSAATQRGGYRYEELEHIKEAHGFREMSYLRVAFFEQLLQRGTLKLGGRCLRRLKPLMRVLDATLDKVVSLVKRHGIVLVWGFSK